MARRHRLAVAKERQIAPKMTMTARKIAISILGPKGAAFIRRYRWSLMCLWESLRLGQKPADPRWLEILADPAFKDSTREVRDLSSLDTARLANLWQWIGMSEEGSIVEVGAFRGGTSLHLSNRWPERRIFICDTFEGFAAIAFRADLDGGVARSSWCNPDAAGVAEMFARRGRKAVVLKGIFPASDRGRDVTSVSFAHIDVDVYESCRDSLEYLVERSTPSAIFVINDYLRVPTRGVSHAVREFISAHPEWTVLPAYPGQGVLLRSLRQAGGLDARAAAAAAGRAAALTLSGPTLAFPA